jgi:hypothetical protein
MGKMQQNVSAKSSFSGIKSAIHAEDSANKRLKMHGKHQGDAPNAGRSSAESSDEVGADEHKRVNNFGI